MGHVNYWLIVIDWFLLGDAGWFNDGALRPEGQVPGGGRAAPGYPGAAEEQQEENLSRQGFIWDLSGSTLYNVHCAAEKAALKNKQFLSLKNFKLKSP